MPHAEKHNGCANEQQAAFLQVQFPSSVNPGCGVLPLRWLKTRLFIQRYRFAQHLGRSQNYPASAPLSRLIKRLFQQQSSQSASAPIAV